VSSLHRHDALAKVVRELDQIGGALGIGLPERLIHARAVGVHVREVRADLVGLGFLDPSDPNRLREQARIALSAQAFVLATMRRARDDRDVRERR
jgi:hypothetical protein